MRLLKSNKGMTVVEIVVALALLGLVSVGIMNFFTNSFKFQARSQNTVVVQKDAEQIMETLKANNGEYEDLKMIDAMKTGSSEENIIINGNEYTYTIDKTIDEKDYKLVITWEKDNEYVTSYLEGTETKIVRVRVCTTEVQLTNKDGIVGTVKSTLRIKEQEGESYYQGEDGFATIDVILVYKDDDNRDLGEQKVEDIMIIPGVNSISVSIEKDDPGSEGKEFLGWKYIDEEANEKTLGKDDDIVIKTESVSGLDEITIELVATWENLMPPTIKPNTSWIDLTKTSNGEGVKEITLGELQTKRGSLDAIIDDCFCAAIDREEDIVVYCVGDSLHIFNNNGTGEIIKANPDSSSFFEMFTNLEYIDFKNFDTSEATDMSRMFYGSHAVTDLDKKANGNHILDLSKFNTENVENMSEMFSNVFANEIDLSSFNTKKVTDMSSMFAGASFDSLDLSSFDTSNVPDMENMFEGIKNLKQITLGKNFEFDGSSSHLVKPADVEYATGYWYKEDGTKLTAAAVASDNRSGNTVYHSRYEYTITLDANGGTIDGQPSKVIYIYDGQSYGTLPTPTKANGQVFDGWYNEKSEKVEEDTLILSKNHALTAKWKSLYGVTFDAATNGGTLIGDSSKEVTVGLPYGELPSASRTGYTFKGWFDAATGGNQVTVETIVTKTENHIVYAHFTANTYAVTLDQRGGIGGITSVTATYGQAMPTITIPERKCTITYDYTQIGGSDTTSVKCTFDGYYDGINGRRYYTSTGTSASNWDKVENTTLYAKWKSQSVTLLTPTSTKYTFAGWYDENGTKIGDARDTYTPTEDITLYAHWNIVLTYDTNGGSGGPGSNSHLLTGTETSHTFDISSTKPTRSGWEFLYWGTTNAYADGDDTNNYNHANNIKGYNERQEITISKNTTLFAIWKKDVTLTYVANLPTDAAGNDIKAQNLPESEDGLTGSITRTIYSPNTSYTFTISSTKPTNMDVVNGYIDASRCVFRGWADSNNAWGQSYNVGKNITVSDNKTIYGVWYYTYTLIFNANGGNCDIGKYTTYSADYATATYDYSTYHKYVNPSINSYFTASRTDYIFKGWSFDSSKEYAEYGESDIVGGFNYKNYRTNNLVIEDKRLYAVWESVYTTYGTILEDGANLSGATIGSYVEYVPSSASYTVYTSDSGYYSSQTYNPSNTKLWRVFNINEDGTVDLITDGLEKNLYIRGEIGYRNFVKILQDLSKAYINDIYAVGARHLGYSESGLTSEQINQYNSITDTLEYDENKNNEFPYKDRQHEKSDSGVNMLVYNKYPILRIFNMTYLPHRDSSTNTYYTPYKDPETGIISQIITDNSLTRFSVGKLYTGNTSPNYTIYQKYANGNDNIWIHDEVVRPIVTLKSGIKVTGGDGSYNNPYTITISE